MSEKRYQVFLSSTYLDLIEERARVLRELAKDDFIATGMEYFPAIDEEQFEFIKNIIAGADYYVCIVAAKYGSLAPDGVSYSEKEYDFACQLGIPVIALLRQNITDLPADLRESEPARIRALESFRGRLGSGRLVAYWRDETELCLQLLASLRATIKKFPRAGWIRGGYDPPEVQARKINDLESRSELLKAELEKIRGAPLVDLVRGRLAESKAILNYEVASSGELKDQYSVSVEWDHVANFVFPRTMMQQTHDGMTSILRAYLEQEVGQKIFSIKPESIDAILDTFTANGLVTSYQSLDRTCFLVSNLGYKYSKTAIHKYESPELQRRELRASQVFNDLGELSVRGIERCIDAVVSLLVKIRK